MFLQYMQGCFEILPTFNKKNGQMCFPILKPKEKKMYEISFELILKFILIHTSAKESW